MLQYEACWSVSNSLPALTSYKWAAEAYYKVQGGWYNNWIRTTIQAWKDKSRRLTENSNWDSREIQSRAKSKLCSFWPYTMNWEKGPDAEVWRQECPESIRCYKNVFSNLYSFPRACLCPKTDKQVAMQRRLPQVTSRIDNVTQIATSNI